MDSSSEDHNIKGDRLVDSKGGGIRNVAALGLVSFFTDFSTEMVLGVLPLFITSSLGASRAILGTIEGSSELTSYAFRIVSGSLSDRIGRRKFFIIAGYGLSTITNRSLRHQAAGLMLL